MKIQKTTPKFNIYTNKIDNNSHYSDLISENNIGFSGKPPEPKSKFCKPIVKFFQPVIKPIKNGVDKLTGKLADGLAILLNSERFKNTFIKINETKKMVQHITCLTSLVLSGFYIKQTLQNDQMEKRQKNTLAVNQAIVALFSAVASYKLDNKISAKTDKFINKFIAANATNDKIGKYVDGIKSAQSFIVFGTVYRFIAPVLLTPIANHIGNKINDKHDAKLAVKSK